MNRNRSQSSLRDNSSVRLCAWVYRWARKWASRWFSLSQPRKPIVNDWDEKLLYHRADGFATLERRAAPTSWNTAAMSLAMPLASLGHEPSPVLRRPSTLDRLDSGAGAGEGPVLQVASLVRFIHPQVAEPAETAKPRVTPATPSEVSAPSATDNPFADVLDSSQWLGSVLGGTGSSKAVSPPSAELLETPNLGGGGGGSPAVSVANSGGGSGGASFETGSSDLGQLRNILSRAGLDNGIPSPGSTAGDHLPSSASSAAAARAVNTLGSGPEVASALPSATSLGRTSHGVDNGADAGPDTVIPYVVPPDLAPLSDHVPKQDIRFEQNLGQSSNADTYFIARNAQYGLQLNSTGATFILAAPTSVPTPDSLPEAPELAVVKMNYVGASAVTPVAYGDALSGTTNYLVGDGPEDWLTDIPSYSGVIYQDLYDGIDLLYYKNDAGQLEYDYLVSPGADTSQIRLEFQGADGVSIDDAGNLVIHTAQGDLLQNTPYLYQDIDGQRTDVSGSFALHDDGSVSFAIGDYDPNVTLVVDPILTASTDLGGSSADYGTGIFRDDDAVYLTGYTISDNFPPSSTPQGDFDAYVVKLSADGSQILSSTRFGGSDNDYALGIAVDGSGQAHVVGATLSSDFSTTTGAFQTSSGGTWDAFLVKLNSSLSSLLYSTYVGGSSAEFGRALAVRANGNAVLVGQTSSSNFPTKEAYQSSLGGSADAFVTELQFNGSGSSDLVFSTYDGGSGSDVAYGVALDDSGAIYFAGQGASGFPTTSGAFQETNGGSLDAFMAKMTHSAGNNAVLAYSSFLGGSGVDAAYGMAVDDSGRAYVTGITTSSSDFPTDNAVQSTYGGGNYDAFVARFTDDGSDVDYSTYQGGSGDDIGYGLALFNGSPYVVGQTSSSDFIDFSETKDSLQYSLAGETDVFLTKLSPDGDAIPFSTYLGGEGGDSAWGVAASSTGIIDLVGYTEGGFPTVGAPQSYAGSYDAFVATVRDSISNVQQNDPYQTLLTGIGNGFTYISQLTGDLLTWLDFTIDCGCNTCPPELMAASAVSYNTGTIEPRPVISTIVTPRSGDTIDDITVTLTWDLGGAEETTVTRTLTNLNTSDPYVVNVQAPAADMGGDPWTTGLYAWKTEVSYTTTDPVTVDLPDSLGSAIVVDRQDSPYGPGWGISTVDQLVEVDDGQGNSGVLWVDAATGYARLFRDGGNNTYRSPANDFGSLVKSGSNFLYTSKEQDVYTFDSGGKLMTIADPHGLLRSYTYDGSDRIQTISLPDESVATFTYSGSYLQSIATKSGTITMMRDGDGNPTTFALPDGNDRTLSYFTPTGRTEDVIEIDPWGPLTETFTYDAFGGIETVDRGLGSVTTYTSQNARGLEASAVAASDNHAVNIDALNQEYTYQLDDSGRLREQTTPDGATYTYDLDFAGNLERYTDPLDRVTTYTYRYGDSKGDLNKITRPDNTVESYQYDSTFHNVTVYQDSLGRLTSYTYNATGDLVTEEDALNNVTTYTYHELSGTSVGLVETVTDALGNVTTYNYDINERHLTSMVDALGNITSYGYDAADNLQTITDALGRVTTTNYDALRRPVETIDALGQITTTVYNAIGQVTSMTDALGRTTTYAYDQRGLQTGMTEAVGTSEERHTTYTYDALERLSTETDPLGHVMTYTYDEVGRTKTVTDPVGAVTTYNYDLAGQLTSTTDARGNTTSYLYDTRSRQTTTIDALGNRATTIYDAESNIIETRDELGRRTTYAYDALNRQVTMEDALGNVMTTGYDAVGNVTATTDQLDRTTSFSYDSIYRQTEVTNPLGDVSTTVYDAVGNSIATVDELGRRTTYTYDALNRVTEVEDALGNVATTVYDAVGNAIVRVDQLGHRTTFTFDNLDRRTEVENPLGYTVTTVYDAASNVIASIDELGRHTTFVYDNANRQVEMIDALGNTSTTVYDLNRNVVATVDERGNRTSYVYDVLNRQIETEDAAGNVSSAVYDAVGNVTAQIDQLGNVTTLAYDALNRQITMERPSSGVTTTLYDAVGNLVNTTDPVGNVTTLVYDALDRQTQTIDARNGTTTNSYDAVGNMVNVIDPVGNQTTFVFDALNREINEIDPSGNTITMTYDAASRMTARVDRNGRVKEYDYDDDDRLLTETWKDSVGGATVNIITHTYDAADNMLTAADDDGVLTYTYDALNRVATQIDVWGETLTFTYDEAGNRTVVADSEGGLETSTYDVLNRLARREYSGQSTELRIDMTYTARSEMESATRYSDLAGTTKVGVSSYTYDATGRLTHLHQQDDSLSNIANYTYTYDLADRVTSETRNGTTKTYTYDATNELTSDSVTTYSYDLNGNRNTGSYSYDPTDTNRLTNDGTYTYTYDAEGNRIEKSKSPTDETWTYVYDHDNHLVGVEERDSSGGTLLMQATYAYDALGRRIEKEVFDGSTTTTRFAWDDQDIWADLDGSSSLATRYMHGDVVDQWLARVSSGGAAAWLLQDRLGSVREIVDDSGSLIDAITYDGFGNIVSETSPANGGRIKFTGREWDSESDLQYNRDRYYDPGLGRWLTEDRLRNEDTNPYRYVGNNPTNATDPQGLLACNAVTRPKVPTKIPSRQETLFSGKPKFEDKWETYMGAIEQHVSGNVARGAGEFRDQEGNIYLIASFNSQLHGKFHPADKKLLVIDDFGKCKNVSGVNAWVFYTREKQVPDPKNKNNVLKLQVFHRVVWYNVKPYATDKEGLYDAKLNSDNYDEIKKAFGAIVAINRDDPARAEKDLDDYIKNHPKIVDQESNFIQSLRFEYKRGVRSGV